MPLPSASDRRHDLDALRAFAMLLGIALHAALSMTGGLWMVIDTRSSGLFFLFVSAVHGFRMPLFFLLSGFFTAMLWRRRGLRALLRHRFQRVFLPLLLGMVTVAPLMFWLGAKAAEQGAQNDASRPPSLWRACATGQMEQVRAFLSQGGSLDVPDPVLGMTPLSHATLHGRDEVVRLLLEKGAKVQGCNRDGGTALHLAAFLGRGDISRALLAAGADKDARNVRGETALDATRVDMGLTRMMARMIKLELNEEAVRSGRHEVRRVLGAAPESEERSRPLLRVWLFATQVPVFSHLWFLWFLGWLLVGFSLCAWVTRRLGWQLGYQRWVVSNWRWLWLLPGTLVPAWLMGQGMPRFGPETSSSLLPPAPLLAYYAVFFAFGALYYDAGDDQGTLGKRWKLTLPLALGMIFPAGLALTYARRSPALLAVLFQGLYAWLMCFGLMGLFRALVPAERPWLRYLSDASYWMYLAHLPLVVAAQLWLRDRPLPAGIKFTLICAGTLAVLLASYAGLVRHTWLGRLLNGQKPAPGRSLA
ncbi:MAG: acyltransferase family protein [Prosthecobacter sp.]|nr:acyltransferase family protein [Prosthecobacter sp.]